MAPEGQLYQQALCKLIQDSARDRREEGVGDGRAWKALLREELLAGLGWRGLVLCEGLPEFLESPGLPTIVQCPLAVLCPLTGHTLVPFQRMTGLS